MHTDIIKTVNYLRKAGLRISPAEILDFCRALQIIELRKDDALTAALCTLAKDKQVQDTLVAAINTYLQYMAADNHLIIPPAVDARAALVSPPHLNHKIFFNRLQNIKDSIRQEIMRINEASISGSSGGDIIGVEAGVRYNTNRTNRQYKLAQRQTMPNRQGTSQNDTTTPGPSNLRQLDLAQADSEQLAEINKIITVMGRQLAAYKGYRKTPAPTGMIDMRRTVRQAAARGGMPVTLKKTQRVPGRPRISIICDLSGSMAPYSVFFLQLLLSLQHKFSKLKSFAFVDHIAEITDLAVTTSGAWNVVARTILRRSRISSTGFSNYGRVWEQFKNDYIHTLTPQTTLIILGDARNNWQPDGTEYLSIITGRCRRTVWLNPLPQISWSINDCIMDTYAPFCSLVLECRNAQQLSLAMKKIISRS